MTLRAAYVKIITRQLRFVSLVPGCDLGWRKCTFCASSLPERIKSQQMLFYVFRLGRRPITERLATWTVVARLRSECAAGGQRKAPFGSRLCSRFGRGGYVGSGLHKRLKRTSLRRPVLFCCSSRKGPCVRSAPWRKTPDLKAKTLQQLNCALIESHCVCACTKVTASLARYQRLK